MTCTDCSSWSLKTSPVKWQALKMALCLSGSRHTFTSHAYPACPLFTEADAKTVKARKTWLEKR